MLAIQLAWKAAHHRTTHYPKSIYLFWLVKLLVTVASCKGLFSLGTNFPEWSTLSFNLVGFRNSRTLQLKMSCERHFLQSLHGYGVSEILAIANENESQITCYATNGDWLFI